MAQQKITVDKPLTIKQERFCNEYLKDLNGTQAAIRAGFKGGAEVTACRMLKQPNIRKIINEKLGNAEIELEPIIQKLLQIALTDHESAAGQAVQVSALDKLMRYKGQFRDKQEISGSGFQAVLNITVKEDE